MAGLDGPALRILAACTRTEADYDVPDLLPPALEDLGLVLCPAGGVAGQEAVVRALAGRMVAGGLTPRELAARVHRRFGHGLPLAGRLAELDDDYDLLGYGAGTPAQLDAEITAEALRLAPSPPPRRRPAAGPADTPA
ncbi:hypothetical protein ACFVGN_33495 [Streptomyces sp. NPDC057757]|uniref:hypothetical protein n=1 Tax=Streptomyces sp. NPDC057757 TaxID=3346241 RepID=UPI00368BB6AF